MNLNLILLGIGQKEGFFKGFNPLDSPFFFGHSVLANEK